MTYSKRFRTNSPSHKEMFKGQHRFEHWYVDNQVYFISGRCRGRFPAFATERAKEVFWQKFDQYTTNYEFVPWITSLLDNHYHTLGYLRIGEALGTMMQRLHGSVAKLVNDLLAKPHKRFWRETSNKNYFDGCIRDENQCRKAYQYTLIQAKRHGIRDDWWNYPHTRMAIDMEVGIKRALELGAFLEGVPYKRYQKRRSR